MSIVRIKCTKFDFRVAGAYSTPPNALAAFKGPTSNSRGREREGQGRQGKERGRGEGKERNGGWHLGPRKA